VNSTAQDEITAYVEGVRTALAGLPEATRDELIEDLPEHLAEVMAEGSGTLIERLGTPEAYASELRATAGFVGGFPEPPVSNWVPLTEVRDDVLRLLGKADVKVGPVIGYEKASDFLVLLRPGWWVLRGYLAAMVISYLFDDSRSSMGLLPRIGGSDLFALVLLLGCVIVSILLGRRAVAGLVPWARYALWSGTTVLVLFALGGFLSADSSSRTAGYSDTSNYGGGNPYSNVQDVFVYDSQGHLVQNARLFDQDGSPIQLGQGLPAVCTDPDTGDSNPSRSLGFPYCPDLAPFGGPSGSPSASASASASADVSSPSDASPSVSASPSGVGPSPSVSAKTGSSTSPSVSSGSGR
jgi:hypothetical protein